MINSALKTQFSTKEGCDAHLAKFASTLGGDPKGFFICCDENRPKPLVVPHATGHPAFEINDDGTLSPYRPVTATGSGHQLEYKGTVDPAKSIFG